MRSLLLVFLFSVCTAQVAHATGSVLCFYSDDLYTSNSVKCTYTSNFVDSASAASANLQSCRQTYGDRCLGHILETSFANNCIAVFASSRGQTSFGERDTRDQAIDAAASYCTMQGWTCKKVLDVCEGYAGLMHVPGEALPPAPRISDNSPLTNQKIAATTPSAPSASLTTPEKSISISSIVFTVLSSLLNFGAIGTGVSFGIGIVLALLVYAKRAFFANVIIHGNLPLKLPMYGEDIQCLFKRTQRVNWYGRTVFGIVVNLAMTHQQLVDVRKYWLGRVIAFDSLRRQRQNELATMHMQLAAKAKSEAHDRKKFWSRRWATLRSFTKKLFWVIIALFNLVMGLFFIRITLAKLVRGTIVESSNLVLILQAKEAIEESTSYLKEYLKTADSFDGGDEIYEPQ